jgi:hypothetical protein
MTAADPNIVRTIKGIAVLVLISGLPFWRIFKNSRGDKFIEYGSITVMVFVATMAATAIPNFPGWALQLLEVLVGVLTFVSLFFLLQQGYRALRRRKTH